MAVMGKLLLVAQGKNSSGNDNHWEEAHVGGSDWVRLEISSQIRLTENFAIIDPDLGVGGTGGVLTNGNLSFRQNQLMEVTFISIHL